MHIRYVEKAASDVLSFKKMFEHRKDVFITACAQLSEIGSRPSDPPIDLLLIDVMNPDKTSVEDDVRTARQYTSAPIVFLTGTDRGSAYARSLRTGAASVVSKQEMSAEMIYRLLENVKKEASPPGDLAAAAEAPHLETGPTFPGWDDAFDYLERGFDARPGAADAGSAEQAAHSREWRRVLADLREIGKRDQNASCECDAAGLLAQAREDLIDFAAAHGAPLLVDAASPATFFVVGSEFDARLGLEAIVLGLVGLRAPGDRLRISIATEDGDQTILRAAADRRFDLELESFFGDGPDAARAASFGLTALRCGAALLGLRPEQCDLSGKERGEIKLRL